MEINDLGKWHIGETYQLSLSTYHYQIIILTD